VEGDALEINRAWWDGAAAIHGDDPIYDTDALIAGADWLGEEEQMALTASVGSMDGLDVIHVQCHIGFDTISLARRGARVTGLDFSPAALAKAEELARRSGVEATWVQADAARIPAHLHGHFDLAYATIGAIYWIEDLPAWMRAVAATLRRGGRFVLVEVHPLLTMVAEREPFSLDFPYSFDGPHRFNEPGTGRLRHRRDVTARHARLREGRALDRIRPRQRSARSRRSPPQRLAGAGSGRTAVAAKRQRPSTGLRPGVHGLQRCQLC
jgi:SAM-dependent methyltransferase